MTEERIHLRLGEPELFDRLVHEGLPQAGEIDIVTKAGATQGGRSGVVIAFYVEIDGEPVRVQATTTVRLLTAALGGLLAVEQREEGMN